MTTLLQLVQQATGEMGLAVPTFVAGNTASDTIQQLALLNAVGYELQREFDWQALETEYRFTTQFVTTTGDLTAASAVVSGIPSTTGLDTTYMLSGAGVNQDTYIQSVDSATQVTLTQAASTTGTAVALTFGKSKYSFPSDYDRQINETQYDKSKRWEMLGPATSQEWQTLKSSYMSTSGPRLRYRIMGGYLQILPAPSTAEYVGFEYISKNWAAATAGTAKSSFTVDTDTCIYPDRLMVLGLKLKYFDVKGFDTTSFERQFEAQKSIAKATDKGAKTLSMSPRYSDGLISIDQVPDTGYGS